MAQLTCSPSSPNAVPAGNLTQAQITYLKERGLYSPTATYSKSYLDSLGLSGGGQTVYVGSQGQYAATTYSGSYVTNPYNPSTTMPAPYLDVYNSINQRLASGEITQAEAEKMHKINAERIAGAKPGYPLTPITASGGGAATTGTSGKTGGTMVPVGSVGGVGDLGTPTVTPAPEYKKSPEQLAWEEMYSGQLEKWIESGGYGIPEETQTQMIQRTTDALKAKEAEDIRVMRNNMERRGLTNSGFVFSNEQKIRANTTMAIANSITDIQIQSALLKMASFERALGAAGEYLGYLSQESQLAYQPKLATWSAQQQANLVAYQAQVQAKLAQYAAQVEMQKMQIAQAYEQQNMRLAAQLSSQAAYQQFQWEKELTQMKIDANEKIAMYQGKGQLVGFGLGALL